MVGNTQLQAEPGKVPVPLCQARKPHDAAYSHKKKLCSSSEKQVNLDKALLWSDLTELTSKT